MQNNMGFQPMGFGAPGSFQPAGIIDDGEEYDDEERERILNA